MSAEIGENGEETIGGNRKGRGSALLSIQSDLKSTQRTFSHIFKFYLNSSKLLYLQRKLTESGISREGRKSWGEGSKEGRHCTFK